MNHSLHSKTAILIFSLSQEAENINKPFLEKGDAAAALNTFIVDKVRNVGVDYFHITEQNQQGDTFAERITNAIAATFKKGYEYVITVGNDSLGLKRKHLRNAITAVHTNKVVVGPSYDGGFYLLGLHKDQFEETSFLSLSWQTSHLYDELKLLFKKVDATECVLPVLHDLDSFQDITKNISALSPKNIRALKVLQQLLTIAVADMKSIFVKAKKQTLYLPFNKGSPLVCS